jgi:hypothetical protein
VADAELVEHQALFERLVEGMAWVVVPSALRVYQHAFSQWRGWSSPITIDPLEVWRAHAGAFLENSPPTWQTSLAWNSAL